MSRRFIAAALAATTTTALVAGCAQDKEQTLPPVEPTSSSTTTSTSSTTTSTSPSSTQEAGWTPMNLPADAPEPLPLNKKQKKAYDAAVAMYEDEYSPALRRLFENPVSTQRARQTLAPYSTGANLPYTAKAVGTYKRENLRSDFKDRLLWRSPQQVSATRVVFRECGESTGTVYRNDKPLPDTTPDDDSTNGKATFVLRDGRWLLSSYSYVEDGGC